jgi:hypothetical protein
MAYEFGSWSPPTPPVGNGEVNVIDPRVVQDHGIGQLPCPPNPDPPDGWEYWRGPVTKFGVDWCVGMLHAPALYPMGSFVQVYEQGQLYGARVEWHNIQGSTGKRGCFRGVNLMRLVT